MTTSLKSKALALLLCALGSAPAYAAKPKPVLATDDQLAIEAQALRVLASPPMQRQIAELEAAYRADPQGAKPAGQATIRRAADSIALAAVYYAVTDAANRPVVAWLCNAPHRWFGMDVPRSGYGIENPDNVYRQVRLDGGARYEIRGRMIPPGPAELHFTVMEALPGTTAMAAEGGNIIGALRSDAMQVAADGTFTVTVDSNPADGRANHITLPAEGKFPMTIRDLFTDWTTQRPVALEVHRIDGPPAAPQASDEQVAEQAAALLAKIGPYWLAYDNQFIYSKPVNTVRTPRHRPGGRGFSTAGHFDLRADEALVITVDPLGAVSLGIQLADPWGVALEYIERTSSLSNAQAQPNADGTVTYVIAASDPGVYNWLDSDGLASGIFAIRWQSLPAGATGERAVRESRVVKISELKKALSAETRFVGPEERRVQRTERAASYARRLE